MYGQIWRFNHKYNRFKMCSAFTNNRAEKISVITVSLEFMYLPFPFSSETLDLDFPKNEE